MPTYDPDNVFAKILRGEIPASPVYEDGATVVIMDIMPRVAGHALVIPRAASRNILDIAPDDLTACAATVQRVARAAIRAFAADGVTVETYGEPAGGQSVFHTHWHVMPRHDGVPLAPHSGAMAPAEEVAAAAAKLRAALAEG